MHTKLLVNGSLALHYVQEDKEGFYLCQASNGIGTGIGKVVQLKVNCKHKYILVIIYFIENNGNEVNYVW